ncbi:MAG: ABC transporter permease subunit [Mycobacteriales bacterium]
MIVATRLLRDRRRSMLWWALGVLVLVAFTAALYPSIRNEAGFDEVIKGLPESMKVIVGYDPNVPVTSPAGYLHGRLFALLAPLVMLVFAISAGSDAIGGAEEAGILEPLLAHPVTRTRVYVERYAANLAMLTALVGLFALTVIVVAGPVGALEGIELTRLAGGCAAMLVLAHVHGAVAFAVGAFTGRRGPAVAVAAALAIAGYLAQSIVALSPSLRWLRFLTPWHAYLDRNTLVYGASAAAFVIPLIAIAGAVTLGHWVFVRRDLR